MTGIKSKNQPFLVTQKNESKVNSILILFPKLLDAYNRLYNDFVNMNLKCVSFRRQLLLWLLNQVFGIGI